MPAEDLLCERWLVRCPAPADLVRRRPVLREEAILLRDAYCAMIAVAARRMGEAKNVPATITVTATRKCSK